MHEHNINSESTIKNNLYKYLKTVNEYLPENTCNAIIDYSKFILAIDYLKVTDWGVPYSIADIALLLFEEGKYYTAESKKDSLKLKRGSFDKLRKEFKSGVENLEYYRKRLSILYEKINNEKRIKIIINRSRLEVSSNKNMVLSERFAAWSLKLHDVVELYSMFCLFSDDIYHEAYDTFEQFRKGKLHLIKYPEYYQLYCFFIDCVNAGCVDDNYNVLCSPLFKIYEFHRIEQRYKLITIKTIASQLRRIKRTTEKEKREKLLHDIKPLLKIPLLKERNEYIKKYLDYYDNGTLDDWKKEVSIIRSALQATLNDSIYEVDKQNDDEFHKFYRELVKSLDIERLKAYLDTLDDGLEYGTDFKDIDIADIFRTWQAQAEEIKEHILTLISEYNKKELCDIDITNVGYDILEILSTDIMYDTYQQHMDIMS